MTKNELIKAVAENANQDEKATTAVINSLIATITDSLKKGEQIAINGFGTFEVKARAERTGINPATKEKITIPATKVPNLKFAKKYKSDLNA